MKHFIAILLVLPHYGRCHEAANSCASGFAGDDTESFGSGANDVVVVQQPDGSLKSTLINVQVGKFTNWQTVMKSREGRVIKIKINGQEIKTEAALVIKDSGKACFRRKESRFRFLQGDLKGVNLTSGVNEGQFVVDSLSITIPFNVFFYQQESRFVLTDIDGTITETDIKGHVFPMFGFTAHHQSVVEMFHKIADNGYNIVYLTARSMAQDVDTRSYLFEDLKDQDGYSLPKGPVFMSPKTFAEALVDALSDPGPVKTATIKTFVNLFSEKEKVVLGAFGNRNSDTKSYIDVGVPTSLIYFVNPKSILRRVSDGKKTSYSEIASNVSELYPKLN